MSQFKTHYLGANMVHFLKSQLAQREEELMNDVAKNPDAPLAEMDNWLFELEDVRRLRNFICQGHTVTRLQIK